MKQGKCLLNLELGKGNHDQNILYEKKFQFKNKRKKADKCVSFSPTHCQFTKVWGTVNTPNFSQLMSLHTVSVYHGP